MRGFNVACVRGQCQVSWAIVTITPPAGRRWRCWKQYASSIQNGVEEVTQRADVICCCIIQQQLTDLSHLTGAVKKSRVSSKHRGPFNPLSQLKMKLKTKLQFEIEISAKMKMKLKLKHKKKEWMKAVCEEWKPREYIQSNAVNQSELSQIHFTNKNISLPGFKSSKNRTKGKWFQKQTGA